MKKYITTDDYKYAMETIGTNLYTDMPYSFNCPQISEQLNETMCPCIGKDYLKYIGSKMIDLRTANFNEGTENDLNSLSCIKTNKLVNFPFTETNTLPQHAFENYNVQIMLLFCVSLEQYGRFNTERKIELLNMFVEFITKQNTHTQVKILVGSYIKSENLSPECSLTKRKNAIVSVLYSFKSKYKDGMNKKDYIDFIEILRKLIIRLNVKDNDDSNLQTMLFKNIEALLTE